MAAIQRRLQIIRQRTRDLPFPRVFQDRSNPLETLSSHEIFQRYRFRPHSILLLVNILFPYLERATGRSCPLPPLLSVLVSLHFLATGAHYIVVGDVHGISASSVCLAIKTTVAILSGVARKKIQFRRDLDAVKAEFFSIAGFPNVIGLVDGTHIRINAPHQYEEDYVNRKGYHSINVQMVCDAGFRIQNVVVKWPGSVHDARIFRQSSLCLDLENGVMDGYLLGDSGYACRRYLLTPYLNTRSQAQERYNRALVKTRVIIEQTCGVLKRRFPCLSYGLRVQPQRCCQIILTCSFLHNFGLDNGDIFDRLDGFDVDQPLDLSDNNASACDPGEYGP
ncbi:putative nuclease HARBI1 [Mya arenaria]|uniref:putative nuclease HARBI1 n=1 Tax=Mya arenaria TaxID=6604 RepID=UPI0022E02451|nr:putative nuclease HARBI1 [Mya arenaria]